MPRKALSATQQIMAGNPNNKTKKDLHKRLKNEKKLDFGSENLKPAFPLNATAKKAFNAIKKTYAKTSFLNDADAYVLTRYCDLLSEYKACINRLKANGRFSDGKVSSDLRFKLNLSAELGKLEKELGLTPAARASLAIHMNDEDDEKENKSDATDDFDENFDLETHLKAVK